MRSICARGRDNTTYTGAPKWLQALRQMFDYCERSLVSPTPSHQRLCVVLWCNKAYLKLRPFPAVVEDLILAWTMYSYRSPEECKFHFDDLQRILLPHSRPTSVRTEQTIQDITVKAVSRHHRRRQPLSANSSTSVICSGTHARLKIVVLFLQLT